MSILSKVRVNGVDYDLMGLGGDVLPVGTEVDIDSTATIPAGWEEVDDKYEIYSTDERCIGRWIDGRPLYQKLVVTNTPSVSSNGTYAEVHKQYLDETINYAFIEAVWYQDSNAQKQPLPYINASGYMMKAFISTPQIISGVTYADQHLIVLSNGTAYNSGNIYAVIKYTKTSDTANSPITKRIKKVSQIMPPELLEKYSTDEVVIGTWIDGKPLYRKVIDFGVLPNNTTKSVSHNILNIDYIKTCIGYATMSETVRGLLVPNYNGSIITNCYLADDKVFVSTNGDRSEFINCFIIIEYTKTTD